MRAKSITKHSNAAGIRTRDGGRWGIGTVHNVLTRTIYIGQHRFNTRFWKNLPGRGTLTDDLRSDLRPVP